MDCRGLGSGIILGLKGGSLMSMERFPTSSSQAILVEIMFVGRLGVRPGDHVLQAGGLKGGGGENSLGGSRASKHQPTDPFCTTKQHISDKVL